MDRDQARYSVLFVCMGNICRSPTVEGVFRELAARELEGWRVAIDSAGTHAYHVGQAPDPRARRAAERRGIDLSALAIFGGALGNFFDRAYHGFVVDFIEVYWRSFHWPNFNVADSAITVGAALLIIDSLFLSGREKAAPQEEAPPD